MKNQQYKWTYDLIFIVHTFLILILDKVISNFHSNLEKSASNDARLVSSLHLVSIIDSYGQYEFSII